MTVLGVAAFGLLLSSAASAQDAAPSAAPPESRERLYHSFQMGVVAIQNRQWDQAITLLSEAVRLDPAESAAWARLGEAYFGLARSKRGADSNAPLQKAVDAYAKAAEGNPGDANYHNSYALALAASGRFEEMQPEMEKAATLDPSRAAQFYYNFGVILLNSARPDAAAAALGKASQAAPGVPEIYFQYASALASQARIADDGKAALPAGAVEAFRKYAETAPNGPFISIVKEALAFNGSTVATSFGEPVVSKSDAPPSIPVGGRVQQGRLLANPSPAYPALARRLRVSGTVSLNALIGEDGAVVGLSLDSGNPILIGAAMNAVKQWTYKPTLLNDKPVRVRTRIDVVFALGR